MIWQSLLALALAIVTVVLHAVGTVHVVIPVTGVWRQNVDSPVQPRPVWTLTRLVGMLLVLHLLEMAVWAAAYSAAGVFTNFDLLRAEGLEEQIGYFGRHLSVDQAIIESMPSVEAT
jgi:hypothetical protein